MLIEALFAIIRDLQINTHLFAVGPIAQLVEQRIENPRVTGSIPVRATTYISESYQRLNSY